MATKSAQLSDHPVPPGDYLAEVLEELHINQAELARRMGRPAQTISAIVRGRRAITAETAWQLEEVLGVAATLWMGLEGDYRLVLAKQARLKAS